MPTNSDQDFVSFTQNDWIAYAWELLEYPSDGLTLDDARDESTDVTIADLRAGRPIHSEDPRFDDVRPMLTNSNTPDDPKSILFEIYSLKEFIEESPHPENTNVRLLAHQLQRLYSEFGITPTNVNSGGLIERVEDQ